MIGAQDHGRHVALVIMKNIIVATDICETLRAVGGMQCDVIHARCLQEAIETIGNPRRIDLAIVEADPDQLECGPLGEAFRNWGTRVILVGEAAEQRGRERGFVVLERPFTANTLEQVLQAALSE
ncbi:hypothetical protein LV82_01211 [Albidovulum inexpectatum]|uniref:Response regulatory domain-containing protein n=1 Tax=Albidovulum inexpectatum TaxID=196587 RepID=A0A2S5JIA1_9RHOB|nr:hypothetical protein [Albidovulum inexpectatum]PPB81169.1 hypothetical protein LV82_01211 [Albidovulum inexpectatum]